MSAIPTSSTNRNQMVQQYIGSEYEDLMVLMGYSDRLLHLLGELKKPGTMPTLTTLNGSLNKIGIPNLALLASKVQDLLKISAFTTSGHTHQMVSIANHLNEMIAVAKVIQAGNLPSNAEIKHLRDDLFAIKNTIPRAAAEAVKIIAKAGDIEVENLVEATAAVEALIRKTEKMAEATVVKAEAIVKTAEATSQKATMKSVGIIARAGDIEVDNLDEAGKLLLKKSHHINAQSVASLAAMHKNMQGGVSETLKIIAKAGDIEVENLVQAQAGVSQSGTVALTTANKALKTAQNVQKTVDASSKAAILEAVKVIAKAGDIEIENMIQAAATLSTAVSGSASSIGNNTAAIAIISKTATQNKAILDAAIKLLQDRGEYRGTFPSFHQVQQLPHPKHGDRALVGTGSSGTPHEEYTYDIHVGKWEALITSFKMVKPAWATAADVTNNIPQHHVDSALLHDELSKVVYAANNSPEIKANAKAIALNTAKKGITPQQEQAIKDNSDKVGITPGQIAAIILNTKRHNQAATGPTNPAPAIVWATAGDVGSSGTKKAIDGVVLADAISKAKIASDLVSQGSITAVSTLEHKVDTEITRANKADHDNDVAIAALKTNEIAAITGKLTTLKTAIDLNTAKHTNIGHPTVSAPVPPNAVFTDHIYDDTSLSTKITANADEITKLKAAPSSAAIVPADQAKIDHITVGADVDLADIATNASDIATLQAKPSWYRGKLPAVTSPTEVPGDDQGGAWYTDSYSADFQAHGWAKVNENDAFFQIGSTKAGSGKVIVFNGKDDEQWARTWANGVWDTDWSRTLTENDMADDFEARTGAGDPHNGVPDKLVNARQMFKAIHGGGDVSFDVTFVAEQPTLAEMQTQLANVPSVDYLKPVQFFMRDASRKTSVSCFYAPNGVNTDKAVYGGTIWWSVGYADNTRPAWKAETEDIKHTLQGITAGTHAAVNKATANEQAIANLPAKYDETALKARVLVNEGAIANLKTNSNYIGVNTQAIAKLAPAFPTADGEYKLKVVSGVATWVTV